MTEHESILKNKNKYQKDSDLYNKLYQATDDTFKFSASVKLWKKKIMYKVSFYAMLLWPECVHKVTFRNCLRMHYMSS